MKSLFNNRYIYRNLHVATGGDDFLTTSAKIHKRNLMYSALLCVVVSIVFYDENFDSVFGFKISGDSGIPSITIISILLVVCIYELISLILYFKLCRALWLWRGQNSDREDDVRDYNSTTEIIKIGLFMYEKDKKRLDNSIKRLNRELLNTYRIYSGIKRDMNRYIVYEKNDGYGNVIDLETLKGIDLIVDSLIKEINVEKNDKLERPINDKIESYIRHRYKYEQLNKEIESNFLAIKKEIEDNTVTLNGFIKRLSDKNDKLISKFEKTQAGYIRYIMMDFLIPSIFAIFAIYIGIVSIHESSASFFDIVPEFILDHYESVKDILLR
ncbi:hypothetical protein NDJ13_09595 [Vibrio alginolyticus]|uniref:hypothetical protein n=1 Tax=Vibrio TaxID=662 RepID=UPI00215FD084|nr:MULTISPECIES: hypothetical protein [Vibrio harveyi group]MCS0138663.1 hypothetical protein [Vibrio alginolyticus]